MCTLKDKLVECGACVAAVILVLAVCYGLSWIVTCGVIKLITMMANTDNGKAYIIGAFTGIG